jgi:uncharacterized repeat protein (TIGR01451 family)
VISAKRVLLALALIVVSMASLAAQAGAATSGPAWSVSAMPISPTNFAPGDSSGNNRFIIQVTNVGSQPAVGPIVVSDFLPQGLTLNPHPNETVSFTALDEGEHKYPCETGQVVRCTFNTTVQPGRRLVVRLPVNIAADAPPTVTNQVTVTGGAPGASDSVQTTISPTPPPFGVQDAFGSLTGVDGLAETRAGSHPYQARLGVLFTSANEHPTENPRDISADLPAGLIVNPEGTQARCTEAQLESTTGNTLSACPRASVVGVAHISMSLFAGLGPTQPVYNMVPPQGRPAELAFNVAGFSIFIHLLGRLRTDGTIGLSSDTLDIPELGEMVGVSVDLWGDPTDPSHDFNRGDCAYPIGFGRPEGCPTEHNKTAFLTMPSACSGPLVSSFTADSWQDRSKSVSATAQTEDENGNPVGVDDCAKLNFTPKTETKLSTNQGETGTGLDIDVDFPNNGLTDPEARAESTTKKVEVTLPEGVTINPSVGEGLGFCTPAQYKKEGNFTIDGEGCPADSKVGTLHVDTPLLKEGIDGFVYLAQQDNPTTTTPGAENPFDTDVALYMVLRNAMRGVLVKQAVKVIPDPKTGQLVATLDDVPQLPFSHFSFHFKEGARAALVSPAACGKYTTVAKFYPWSDPSNPRFADSSFEIDKGVNGGPCPPGGIPPFKPSFEAGSLNNNAKSYSPFNMRLIRHDGEQDMTKFSAVLPPGVLGKLAGISKCSDAAINAAKGKTGRQELASPSCPANSQIGSTFAGAGVGDSLTYVPGKLYLGGPYNGDPLSVISITPALAGPFDAGTVVVREALTLNPVTAEVEVDGAHSDPIPHILKGIVLKVRDLRVYVDKPEFIVNPTNCEPSSAKATLFGAFRNVFDPSDDVPVDLATRYQAANCLNLPFKPKLSIELHGGTKRGDHPALKAIVSAKPNEANIGKAVVTLPQSAFLDQAHIRTICTRVQYAANGGAGGGCPKAAQYGYARAFTPLLDEPVEGPVYLRSSNHKLPDLVAALHGIVNVDIVGRIDSFKGGIRSSFETVPDAPVSKFILNMQGGKKGLVVNSRNLCAATNRGIAALTGQNGVPYNFKPVVKPSCGKARKHKKHH